MSNIEPTLIEAENILRTAFLERLEAEWQAAVNREYERVAKHEIFSAEATENLHGIAPALSRAAMQYVREKHGVLLASYVRSALGRDPEDEIFTIPAIFPAVNLRVS